VISARGRSSAVDRAPRLANVIALSGSVLASMSVDVFQKILRDHLEVSTKMMTYLIDLVRNLSDRVVEFSVLSVRNRIHAELLRLAREQASDGETATLSPPPTHADIASRVAIHREAVTREMNALAGNGLIERRPGTLVIREVSRLTRLVEEGLER
jgi:CRP/FNR family cyclic AMP-dependent transcriptional regulator